MPLTKNQNYIEVFKDTIRTYSIEYAEYTDELCKGGTTVYTDDVQDIIDSFDKRKMKVSVIVGDTVETGRQWVEKHPDKVTAVLNFADAIIPGGMVLVGASTQEEHICRCSNLYASITTDIADELYYKVNSKSFLRGIYTNSVIYSKNVLFFRSGSDYSFLEKPYQMDVITCPAPSSWLSESYATKIIRYRAERIIQSAIKNGVDNLILGAWGCGAFGQEPEIVAKCFKSILKKYPAFDNVVFAIRNCSADYENLTTSNYAVFKRILDNGKSRKAV